VAVKIEFKIRATKNTKSPFIFINCLFFLIIPNFNVF